ncbi:hypothetical protein H6P81_005663 [Aristolochia fimbriata]|uniref:Uncharacterized protein n=1 Tax=Aristolochia fimbriata TaxID=158543 RepID=A0AAV7EVT7_ARIFI|nr:hypothetical protein H6P81_005663 [Aristolochia fimbriata]
MRSVKKGHRRESDAVECLRRVLRSPSVCTSDLRLRSPDKVLVASMTMQRKTARAESAMVGAVNPKTCHFGKLALAILSSSSSSSSKNSLPFLFPFFFPHFLLPSPNHFIDFEAGRTLLRKYPQRKGERPVQKPTRSTWSPDSACTVTLCESRVRMISAVEIRNPTAAKNRGKEESPLTRVWKKRKIRKRGWIWQAKVEVERRMIHHERRVGYGEKRKREERVQKRGGVEWWIHCVVVFLPHSP